MKNINIMIKPASSLCNLRCKYCFYADVVKNRDVESCGIMTESTVCKMLRNIEADLETGDRVNFAFQGGEPMIAGLDFFENFVNQVQAWNKKVKVNYALQTNATQIDEKWCEFLKKHNFLLGVSLDILPDCHDAVRVDTQGKGTYKSILQKIRMLNQYKVEYNVLCTLTKFVAKHPQKVWNTICQLDLQYVQFTPCLGELDQREKTIYELTPKLFSSFYKHIFQLWYKDYSAGIYRSIKFFDDVVNLMVLGRPTSCGMNGPCQAQLVIEGDGRAYPCDFYCLDEYCLGNITEKGVTELLKSKEVENFINRLHTSPNLCKTCKYNLFCGGNCKRMQENICCSMDDSFCGYKDFLDFSANSLSQIAQSIRKRKF